MNGQIQQQREGSIRRFSARAQLLGSSALFGLLAALTRKATQGGFTSGQISVVRFTTGVALTLGWFLARPSSFAPVKHRLLVTRGILGGFAAFLYFVAIARIPAGEATLLNSMFPIPATLFAYFSLRERPTIHLATGLVLASLGVFLVLGGGSMRITMGWGELAGIGSACFAALAVNAVRALRATDNAATIFFAFSIGGLVVAAPFAFGSWPTEAWLWALAILGVGGSSFGAQMLMTEAYGALTVSEAAILQQLTPVASYLWALGLLDERLGSMGIFGVFLGLVGVVYGSVWGRARNQTSAEAPDG